MTPMAAKCGYTKCSSYLIGYLEATSIGMNITKQVVFLIDHVRLLADLKQLVMK